LYHLKSVTSTTCWWLNSLQKVATLNVAMTCAIS
jgi:hypothetical protein